MSFEACYITKGESIDHTPAAAVSGGDVVIIAGKVYIASIDIAAGELGAVVAMGIFDGRVTAAVGNIGDNLWWDADGDPYGDTAGIGAFTTIASDGDYWVGTLLVASGATDSTARFALNVENPSLPAWPNRVHETKDDDYTIDVNDVGKVLHMATDAKTFTVPATAVGLDVIIQNDAADAGIAINVSPQADDKFQGLDIAGVNDKDLILTKLTSIRGDYLSLKTGDTNGPLVVEKRGTWAVEA